MGMSEASRFRTCHADECCGAGGEDRTPDLRFTKPLHYRCATPAQAVISPALIELQAVPERGPSSRVRARSALGRERSLLLPICYLIGSEMTRASSKSLSRKLKFRWPRCLFTAYKAVALPAELNRREFKPGYQRRPSSASAQGS